MAVVRSLCDVYAAIFCAGIGSYEPQLSNTFEPDPASPIALYQNQQTRREFWMSTHDVLARMRARISAVFKARCDDGVSAMVGLCMGAISVASDGASITKEQDGP